VERNSASIKGRRLRHPARAAARFATRYRPAERKLLDLSFTGTAMASQNALHSHGFVPRKAPTVLLILDMISDYRFPDGAEVFAAARGIAPAIRQLKRRAARQGIPCVYVNDNIGRWRSDSSAMLRHCARRTSRGAPIVRLLKPTSRDCIVLKPRHSGFYATPLDALLEQFAARTLILTGVSSHQCILFTANDAYVRGYKLRVPSDCVASPAVSETRFALRYFESVLRADITPAAVR
jgi:nicotinamidase-related amidase